MASFSASLRLSEALYRAGIDDDFSTLTARRCTYSAQQGFVAVVLDDYLNRVTSIRCSAAQPTTGRWIRALDESRGEAGLI